MAEVIKWPVWVKLFKFSSLEIMRKPGDLLQLTDVISSSLLSVKLFLARYTCSRSNIIFSIFLLADFREAMNAFDYP